MERLTGIWSKTKKKELKELNCEEVNETIYRPPCPVCSGKDIVSNGKLRWLCNDCGKQFGKIKINRG